MRSRKVCTDESLLNSRASTPLRQVSTSLGTKVAFVSDSASRMGGFSPAPQTVAASSVSYSVVQHKLPIALVASRRP